MRIIIHILIWVIALLFIGDQLIQIFGKDTSKKANSSVAGNEPATSGSSKKSNLPSLPPPPDPTAMVTKAMLDNSLVEIEKAIGNGAELIITGTVTNQGTDGYLRFHAAYYGEATRLYDDNGNKIVCSSIEVGNQKDTSSINVKLVSGVKVPIKMRFNMPTVAGQTQAKKIALLELWAANEQQIKCEFRNIKIEKVGEKATLSPSPSPGVATPTPNPSATPKE